MDFPVFFEIGPVRLHPHFVFEALAYAVGFRWFLAERRRTGDVLNDGQRLAIVAAAALGAVVGSKLLVWFVDPAATWQAARADAWTLVGGKTIVGALAGGILAVEAAKRVMGVADRTGDAFAVPMAIAIAIGRVGCFLTGLADHTYGVATALPWGVDFGDGVTRHPTQLYEALFVLVLAGGLVWRRRHRETAPGSQWNLFILAYLAWRFVVAFIQPDVRFAGLTTIQWTAAALATFIVNTGPPLRSDARQTPSSAPGGGHRFGVDATRSEADPQPRSTARIVRGRTEPAVRADRSAADRPDADLSREDAPSS